MDVFKNKGEEEKNQPKGDDGADDNQDSKGGGSGDAGSSVEMKKGDYMVHVYI